MNNKNHLEDLLSLVLAQYLLHSVVLNASYRFGKHPARNTCGRVLGRVVSVS